MSLTVVKQIERRYLAYQLFRNFWLVGAIWLLYYRLFMSDQQVGVLDAISFSLGLLAEIPSGALADYLGRKKLIIVGLICGGIGMAMQGFIGSYGGILAGQLLVTTGWAFCSGADTALFYEAVIKEKPTYDWKKLVAKGGQVLLATSLVAYVIGGYLFTLSPGLPFIVMGVISLLAIFPVVGVSEIRRKKDGSSHGYVSDLKDGTKQLLLHEVLPYLSLIIVLQGILYTYGFGLLRPLLQVRFGLDAQGGAWALAIIGIFVFIAISLQAKYIHTIKESRAVTYFVVSTAAVLLLATQNIGVLGVLVLFVMNANEYLMEPWINEALNKHISSKHRATALSAAAFLKSAPYVLSAMLIGYLSTQGLLHYYLYCASIGVVLAGFVYTYKKKDKRLVSHP